MPEKRHYDETCTILKEIFDIIKELKLSPYRLHEKTGLPYHWIQKLIYRKVKDPRINRTMFFYGKLKKMQNLKRPKRNI